MAVYFNPNVVTRGLVLNLDAGNKKSYSGSGTTWYDTSSNGNDISLVNSTTYSSDKLGAIKFNGTDSYANGPDTSMRINGPNFTGELVFYFNGNNYNTQLLCGKRNPNPPYQQWWIGILNGDVYNGGTGKVLTAFLRHDGNTTLAYDRVLTYALSSAGVCHVCLTNDSASANLYLNGTLVSTSSATQANATYNIVGYNYRIANVNTATYFDEKIYQARFYNRTLTPQEALQNFNAVKGRFGI